jgi:hypothetical protein
MKRDITFEFTMRLPSRSWTYRAQMWLARLFR